VEVVIGGGGFVEIFNLDTKEWRRGPRLPQEFDRLEKGAASVQLSDKTFVFMGGYKTPEYVRLAVKNIKAL